MKIVIREGMKKGDLSLRSRQFNYMGSETLQRRGGQPSWVLQEKKKFARGRTLRAGRPAPEVLGVSKSSVLLSCEKETKDKGVGEVCLGAGT